MKKIHWSQEERDVYQVLVATCLQAKEIADKLGYEYRTVRTIIERLYKKLNVHSRTELILQARSLDE